MGWSLISSQAVVTEVLSKQSCLVQYCSDIWTKYFAEVTTEALTLISKKKMTNLELGTVVIQTSNRHVF